MLAHQQQRRLLGGANGAAGSRCGGAASSSSSCAAPAAAGVSCPRLPARRAASLAAARPLRQAAQAAAAASAPCSSCGGQGAAGAVAGSTRQRAASVTAAAAAHAVASTSAPWSTPRHAVRRAPRCRAAAPPAGSGGPGSGGSGAGGGGNPGQPGSWSELPNPWDAPPRPASAATAPPGGSGSGIDNGGAYGSAYASNGYTAPGAPGSNGRPDYEMTDWGWGAGEQGWDPAEGLSPEQRASLAADYEAYLARQRASQDPPRDKWITPLLDWQSITGAFDPDQRRTEDAMADEALTNKSESREALAFAGRLIAIPIVTGALVGRALAEPILSFTLANNPDAFAMTGRQKIEGASRVHQEEARVRMLMAIGQAPPLREEEMLQHLREFALEVQEEERHRNEQGLITLTCDSVSAMVFFVILARDIEGRTALSSTIGRLFEGLSDIAKAVLIILIADTLLGYHSEEGWTGLIDVVLGHYGVEVEEKDIVLFVGIIPIAIDVLFKWWIFVGLNRISPGAVVTIKQLDRH